MISIIKYTKMTPCIRCCRTFGRRLCSTAQPRFSYKTNYQRVKAVNPWAKPNAIPATPIPRRSRIVSNAVNGARNTQHPPPQPPCMQVGLGIQIRSRDIRYNHHGITHASTVPPAASSTPPSRERPRRFWKRSKGLASARAFCTCTGCVWSWAISGQ